jgi:hypothetical protein
MTPVGRRGVSYAILPGAVLMLVGSTLATPAPRPTVPPHTRAETALYSPRARRLVQTYLRLRLLETREADLERVRAVIERRLGIDALLVEETPRPRAR